MFQEDPRLCLNPYHNTKHRLCKQNDPEGLLHTKGI